MILNNPTVAGISPIVKTVLFTASSKFTVPPDVWMISSDGCGGGGGGGGGDPTPGGGGGGGGPSQGWIGLTVPVVPAGRTATTPLKVPAPERMFSVSVTRKVSFTPVIGPPEPGSGGVLVSARR